VIVFQEETIAAIATPPGVGGIGIIRVSGPEAEDICRKLFRPRKSTTHLQSHHLYHGEIISPRTDAVIDEVLVSVMRKPHTYTGDDTFEINCHGGPLILRDVLEAVVNAGARLAGPGEFTRRAFLNNRIDLSQAEAVMDLITARTERGRDMALSHLRGGLSLKIREIRDTLVDVLAHLEIAIDFTEEDIHPESDEGLTRKIRAVASDIRGMLATYREGKLHREGFSVVITGKPNVGKSSLLNRLLGQRRAIVTGTPGTTRDFIEETVSIRGIPVVCTDTAGIRECSEEVEREGIDFVWQKVSSADLVIILLDGSSPLTGEDRDIVEGNRERPAMVVCNKNDLPHALTDEACRVLRPEGAPLWISAKFGEGIEELKERIYDVATAGEQAAASEWVVTNLRHKQALEKAGEQLAKAEEGVEKGLSPELPAFDVREALDALGEIVGETTNEEILDRIFSEFCIGK